MFDSVRVENFRSILDSGQIELGPITILIGPNNSGKSSLLRSILCLQGGLGYARGDIRHGAAEARIIARTSPPYPAFMTGPNHRTDLSGQPTLWLEAEIGSSVATKISWGPNVGSTAVSVPHQRPYHPIVPLLSRRKSSYYQSQVSQDAARVIQISDDGLTSRLVALSPDHEEGRRYHDLMHQILGVKVSTYLGDSGPVPGFPLSSSEGIDLQRMGEGVANVVTLASELADHSSPRLFLIEEPENDLHPEALRELLNVLVEESAFHQFIVTTHSDVTLTVLGSQSSSKVYEVEVHKDGQLLNSSYTPVADAFDRQRVLRSLGYKESLPLAWLVLEESSAETFIKEVLIPMFAPRLAALRTVAAGGTGKVSSMLMAFHQTVLFAHLTQQGQAPAWVLVDGDASGVAVVKQLREKFTAWPPTRFRHLAEDDIEAYYPSIFGDQVSEVRRNDDGREKMRLKGALVQEVVRWSVQEPVEAREALLSSAADVIDMLQLIESEIAALQISRK